ncbi:ribonucleoside-triphosphate reductase, adenosylcobalamin-dependent [Bacillus mycoides]|uniref:ribonucleoside-triphosphate reductase, adenosylcobalamin-dependent n=1 Tax=Bacillus mycoides TaxID=1405 RepID=UPI002111B38C|nr:ribonucleoside-triphosphate reductase, adenosylcobalamin-dependent [Bacillus mycoides]MCQ6531111.1 ribonucleoside-triphosphate reductase, adenosylcobalamin-dependent [Bacillus mycoides]
MIKILTDKFINQYPNTPKHMNALANFVFYRTYSRYLPNKERREYWKETCIRAVEFNINLHYKHIKKKGLELNVQQLRTEGEELFDNMFNLKQFLPGRTLFIGGAPYNIAEKFALANFNSGFLNITHWADFCDLFYLLMVGTGVGFKATKELVKNLPPIRKDLEIKFYPYTPVEVSQRLQNTNLIGKEYGCMELLVGDSKIGWVDSLRYYFDILTKIEYRHVHTLYVSLNHLRAKGETLHTFGGIAPGPLPLKELFYKIQKVIRNEIDSNLVPLEIIDKTLVKVRPIHVLDIGNLIAATAIAGGIRRSAEIFLFDIDDYECLFAKYGINGTWSEKNHHEILEKMNQANIPIPKWLQNFKQTNAYLPSLSHRHMSNNSISFTNKPSKKFIDFLFTMMRAEGEPGFLNFSSAQKRRPNFDGVNSCAEVLLASYGVCNLTTINLVQFVKETKITNTSTITRKLDIDSLKKAQRLSVRAGLRTTLLELELPKWNEIQQRDRLIGASLTGFKDAMELIKADLNYEKQLLKILRTEAHKEVKRYAKELSVSSPLLVTTIKPEGTVSLLAGGVSNGLHYSHSSYYIRRIRIDASDPLAKTAMALGWEVNAEIGTPGPTKESQFKNAHTLVIDFPVASSSEYTKETISAQEQLTNYFLFQKYYTDHNSSTTITVKNSEWEGLSEMIYKQWVDFTAVSFISHNGGSYSLMPYESITEEQYNQLIKDYKPFDPNILRLFDNKDSNTNS